MAIIVDRPKLKWWEHLYLPALAQGMRVTLGHMIRSLRGKTIYLVDARFDDGDLLMIEMANWFAEHMPDVRTVLRSKVGTHSDDDPALWEEIKAEGDGAVIAVGH